MKFGTHVRQGILFKYIATIFWYLISELKYEVYSKRIYSQSSIIRPSIIHASMIRGPRLSAFFGQNLVLQTFFRWNLLRNFWKLFYINYTFKRIQKDRNSVALNQNDLTSKWLWSIYLIKSASYAHIWYHSRWPFWLGPT